MYANIMKSMRRKNMWIREKDEVQMGKQKFSIKQITGLYSSSPVMVTIENILTKRCKTYTILEFNQLADTGKIKVKTQGRKAFGYG